MTYKQLQIIDPSIEDDTVGIYGMRWLDFMEQNHPKLMKKLKANRTLTAVARSVDESAWNYRELLERQYEKLHPRPYHFAETVKWEHTREFYTDSAVMREKVLIPLTQP